MIKYEKFNPVHLTHDLPHDQHEWRNDPSMWKWFRQYTLISDVEQENWEQAVHFDKSVKMFGIKACGIFVGTCGLTSIDKHNQNAEFSLMISPKYQGHGYGSKALSSLLEHGFRDHNLQRIWGETFDGNPAAKMFAKIGMIHEGVKRSSYYRDGKFIDCHLYSMLKEEWLDG